MFGLMRLALFLFMCSRAVPKALTAHLSGAAGRGIAPDQPVPRVAGL